MADMIEVNMNVAALKRVDPYIKDILETATHVALYTFSAENNEWEKTDIEGALFVYSRSGEPYNSIVIMNRLNVNNHVEPVTQGLDLQLQEPFLLYKNSKCNIYGIWFYDKDECIRIAAMLKQLVKDSEENRRTSTSSKSKKQLFNMTNSTNNVDIFSMLSKAQKNFNTSRGGVGNNNDQPKSPRDTAEAPSHSTSIQTHGGLFDGSSQSVLDFFAKAKVNTSHFNSSVDHKQSPGNVHGTTEKPLLLAHLMSNPAAHTLEHIEKQQRSITPQPTTLSSIVPPTTAFMGLNTKNRTPVNKLKRQHSKPSTQQESITSQEIHHHISKPGVVTETSDNSATFLRIQSPMTTPVSSHPPGNIYHSIGESMTFTSKETSTNRNSISTKSESLVAHRTLLPDSVISSLPMSFASMGIDGKSLSGADEIISTPRKLASTVQPALIPPVMFSASSPSDLTTRPQVEPLTKNQLLQALNYLIKNDPDFMLKLHEAYVKSFNEILS